MSHGFSKEQVEEFHAAFSTFHEELSDVTKRLGENLSESELKELVARGDTDGDGTINSDEFLAAMAKGSKLAGREEELKAVFGIFEQNGDGHISVEELKQAVSQLGANLSQEDLGAMIREADVDKDGKVNYEEFVRILQAK